MTRPPLELLAAVRAAVEGVRAQVQTMGVPEMHWGTLDGMDDVLLGALSDLEYLESALRAQAEADKGLREALAHYAELRHYDHAGRLWSGNPDEHEDAQVDFGEIARAALAQAGGESL